MTMQRKSWSDQQGIPTGVIGDIYRNGGMTINIQEKNRATIYEWRREGIEILQKILRENYLRKGIRAVLFGIHDTKVIKYAIFVQDNFLKEID